MKKKFFKLSFLGLALISLFTISCNENSDLITHEGTSFKEIKKDNFQNNVVPLPPNCLNETVVDSFIYYINEFNNYFLQDTNEVILSDSFNLIVLAQNSTISSFSEFCSFISGNFKIPLEIVKGTCIYSAKVLPNLLRENENNHPIAERWYFLIKSGCISTILPHEMFINDTLEVNIRKGCSFWELFTSCAGLAASVAGAVTIETVTVGAGTIAAVGVAASGYGYYHAVKKCL